MTALHDIRTESKRAVQVPISYPARDVPGTEHRHKLLDAVQAALKKINVTTLRAPANARPGAACQPLALLGLLTFWYARQVYSSPEILARLRLDMARHRLSDDCLPDVAMLREFRSQNRMVLECCLSTTLELTLGQKVSEGMLTHIADGHYASEAKRRVTMGLFTDTLEAEATDLENDSPEKGFIIAKE